MKRHAGLLLTVGIVAQLCLPLALATGASATPSGTPSLVLPLDATPSSCGGTASGNTDFRAVHFNVLGSTFGSNWSTRRSVVIKRLSHVLNNSDTARASIYGLTEVTSSEADWIAQQLGPNYAVAVHNRLQAIVFDTTTWTVKDTGQYTFTTGSTAYHGFVHARLKNTSTGAQVNVIETHLVPNSVSGAASKRAAQLSQITSTVGSWVNPVLILGDMNWKLSDGFETAAGSGYCSVRKWAGSYSPSDAAGYRTDGGSENPGSNKYGSGEPIIDYGLVHHGITMRACRVLRGTCDNTRAGSDHRMLTRHLTM